MCLPFFSTQIAMICSGMMYKYDFIVTKYISNLSVKFSELKKF